jgi:hypothetical protein
MMPGDTKTVACAGLPSNASWNTAPSITQTRDENSWSWLPSVTGTYNTVASTSECRFRCNANHTRRNSTCAPTQAVNCTGLPNGASWNSVSRITQTRSGSAWTPSTTGTYNTTASVTECRFRCNPNYTRNA